MVSAESVVIVAGATSGVGLRTVERLGEMGVERVLLVGRDVTRGEAARQRAEAAGVREAVFVSTDLGDAAGAQSVVRQALDRWGRVDVLVAALNGLAAPQLVHRTAIEQAQGVVLGQLMAQVHMCMAVLPTMREQGSGSIVTMSSDAAKVPTPGEALIGAAMAGIVMFTKTLAVEAKRDGIRANVVTPSIINDTGGYRTIMSDPFSAKLFEKAIPLASLGVPDPDDVANLVLFLAGEQASHITGQAISINGGISTV